LAIGEFISVLDTQGFALYSGKHHQLCKRNKNVVVLLSPQTTNHNALVRSILINDAGSITATPEDSLQLWATVSSDFALIHWSGDVFVAMVNDNLGKNRLITFTVSGAGVIPAAITDFMALANSSNLNSLSQLLRPYDEIILTAPCLGAANTRLESANVLLNGAMPDNPIDDVDLGIQPAQCRFRHGSGERIVGAFCGGAALNIFSFTCDVNGSLPATPDDAWSAYAITSPNLGFAKVTNYVYAIFTNDNDNNVRIRTFSINPDGTINKSFIDTEVVGAAVDVGPYMVELGEGYFIVAYSPTTSVGRLKTYFIDTDGEITDGEIDSHDPACTGFGIVTMVHLFDNNWALCFQNTNTEIMIHTLSIQTPGAALSHGEMTMGMGP